MAKKSNKTAHVLNLLSGHDAAKEAEEASLMDEEISDKTAGQASQSAPAEAKASGNEEPAAAVPPGAPAPQQAPAPVIAPTASQNNISLIDTTGEDPVADLIQEKLSSEFEKQMQESQGGVSAAGQAMMDSDVSLVEEETAVSGADSVEDEAADAGSMENEGAVSDAGAREVDMGGTDSTSMENKAAVSEPMPSGTSSEDNSDLQEALDLNSIENANSLTETEEEREAIAEMEADLETGPQAAVQAVSAPQPEPEPEPEPDFAYVNVMERIVQDKIIYFMRQFDVCTCERCKADVVALTMNGLMPKYIVTMPSAVDPLISYYTNRLISDVTVEATKACMVVKENPRH